MTGYFRLLIGLTMLLLAAVIGRAADVAETGAAAKPNAKPAATTSADPDALAARTFAIFEAKCAACHAPKAEKVHKFDTILNFEALRANKKLLIPGNAAESSIYTSIAEGEMPPQQKHKPLLPLLTDDEQKTVEDWINTGAPVGKTVAVIAPAGPPKSFMEKLTRWLGNFHPIAAHTPIAVLMAAAIAEMMYLKYRAPAFTGAARFCAVLGGMGALATAGLGWLMYMYHVSAEKDLVETHKWMGTIAGALAIPIAILGEWGVRHARRQGREWHGFSRWTFRVLVFGIAGLVGFVGHLGGMAHWGEHFLDWPQ